MINNEWGIRSYPVVPGHEVSGTVAALGSQVSSLRVGQKVGLGSYSGYCGGITVFNPLVQFDVKPTDKVGVIGIGGLGHIALQILNARGCKVTAFTSSDAKVEEAKSLGAHQCINSRDPQAIAAAAGSFDFIISTVNVKLDWNHGKQKRVKRPEMIDGLTVDEFIENNADDLWYHQNEMWECIKTDGLFIN